MSYCRWSDNDFSCDLYCYDDVHGGTTTHVAGRRYVFSKPLPPPAPFPRDRENRRGIAKWLRRQRVMGKMIDRARLVKIGLPFDGMTFNDDAEGFLARLQDLRAVGYRFPDYVIEAAEEELS